MSVGRNPRRVACSRILKGSSCERRRKKVAHPHEVVTGERHQSRDLDLVAAAALRSTQQADVLAPSEDFLDQLTCLQAQRVSRVAGCTVIDCRATPALD